MRFELNDSLTITSSNELILKNTSVPFDLSSRSDGIILPIGTTFERPQLPFLGMMRFNSSLSQPEVYTFYGWTTLDTDYSTLIDISPRSLPHSNDIATITGRDFVPGMLFEFVGSTGISHIVPSWSLMSSTIVQATRPSVMPPSEEPYTLRVTMPSGVQYELPDIVEVGDYPIILTPAAGSLGTFSSGCNITPITFTASDSDGSNIVSMTKTSDLSQLSFAYNNSNVATLTGITTQILQATSTYNFTLDAMDSGSNVASRNYSITVLYTPLAITSVVPANLSQNLLTNSYSTSYTFSANKTGVVWSLSPSSAYATINTSTGVMSVAFNQGVVTFGSFTVTASWGIDSTSQSWTYNMYSYDTSVYPTNAWAILDVTMLSSQANNSTVEQWGVQRVFKQATVANRPTYVSTGGYNNGPYVFFNRTNSTFLDAGAQTFSISTNGGFTIMCLMKFTGSAASWERIIDFGSGAPVDNVLFARNGTSGELAINVHNSATGYGLTSSTSPIVLEQWSVVAARWIKGSKLQLYKNNVLQNELSFTTILSDKTYTNTYIGKSFWADAFLNAHISKHFTYDRALSDTEMSLIYAKMINAPAITLRPANITTQNTSSALYSIVYAFTGVASAGTLAWTLNTTTYGNINASTGALTLTFPIYTTASGTFIVTATDSNGSSTYSWTYAITNIPLITSSQPAVITQSTGAASYSTSYTFTANQTVTWSLNTTTYGSINSSTGALTLTFPLYTTASGTFIVTATNQAGFTSTQSWSYGITNIPTITSALPTKITQSTNTSAYETSYTFTANQAVTWSIAPTTYGTINSSTGVLTLVFPTPTDTKGTFTVSATNASGFAGTQSWDYDITSATFYTQSGKVLRRQSGAITDSSRFGFDTAFNNTNGTLTYQTSFSLPGSDNFSMEYTAWFVVPVTGTYSFGLTSDDGADLAFYVNTGWQVISPAYGFKGTESTPTTPGSITLTAGVLNPIRVRHHEGGGGEALNVFMYVGPLSTAVWSTVPISYFRVPLDASPTVSTITANGFPSPAVQPVSITSAQPANLTGSTFSATNTTSYTFTSGAAVTWSITPTTYGDIHPTNGQLTLTFPQETTASGTFVVTATYLNNSVTQTWTYNISASLQVVYSGTASPGSSIQSSFNIFTFSVPAFHKCDSLIYNVTYTKPSNSYGLDNLNYRLFDTVTSTFVNNNSTLATGSGMPPSGGTRSLSVTLTNPVFTLVPDRVYALRIDWWSSYAFFSSINTSFVMNYKPYDLAPIITSTQPANINENVNVAPYTTSYSFTGTVTSGSIVWSLTPTTYGNIDSSTGDLTLTFPQGVTSSGTFVVTASAYNGATATRSWTYATTTPPLVITSTQPTAISQSTGSALYTVSYTFAGTPSAGSIVWSLTPTTYGNINSSTGALTLTFPQGTAASGTFIVTATDTYGSVTQSWTYAVIGTALPNVVSSTLSQLINWYDANTGLTISGTGISQWNDLSSYSRHLTQATVAQQPILSSTDINGFPGVNFGNIAGKLMTCTGSGFTTNTATFVFVLNPLSKTTSFSQFLSTAGTWLSGSIHQTFKNNSFFQGINSGGVDDYASSFAITPGTPCILVVEHNSSNKTTQIRGNGVAFANFNSYTNSPALLLSSLEIGGWSGDSSRTFNGSIGEIMVFNVLLSETDKQKIEGYLAQKWWTSNNPLQESHPYKSIYPSPLSISIQTPIVKLSQAPSSGATWTDESGNGNNGTIGGTYSYTNEFGGGIVSTSGYISVPYNITGTVTISIVAKLTPSAYWATLWANESYTAAKGYFSFFESAGNLLTGAPWSGSVSGGNAYAITGQSSINAWDFVISGTTYTLYKNGLEVDTGSFAAPSGGVATTNLYFGARHGNAGTGYTDVCPGTYYQMMVFNNALTSAQITQNFNSMQSRFFNVSGAFDSTLVSQMPVAAYSLRRLFATYQGPQVRVRRSVDNYEADVYFDSTRTVYRIVSTAGGDDWATWISGKTLYITTWYDQSGVGNHVTQTSTSKQPTLNTSKNAVEFDSTLSQCLQRLPGVLAAGDDTYTFGGAFEPRNTNLSVLFEQHISNGSTSTLSSTRACAILINGNIGHNGQDNDAHNIVAYALNQKNKFVMRINNASSPNVRLNYNGSSYTATSGTPTNLAVSGEAFAIGFKVSANAEYFNGFMYEAFVYNVDVPDDFVTSLNTAMDDTIAVTTTIPSNYTIYVDHNTSSSYFINDVSTLPTFDTANQRIVFNRSSKYLDVGSRTFSMLTNGWTHLIKLNLTAQSNGVDRIFDSGAENNNYISFLLTSTNALRFLVRNSTNTALCDITTTQTLALNTTYVLAARTTSTMASIWINGVKVKEVSCIPTDRTNNNSRIGIDPYLSSAQLSAYVYKVYVYNYALSDTDIGYFT